MEPVQPARAAVTAAEIAGATTREAALALLERGANRQAVEAHLASLGFVAIATASEPVYRKPAGEPWRDYPSCPELVLVPSGTTSMQVTIAETTKQLDFRFDAPLAVARFEVTRGQYAAFARETAAPATPDAMPASPHGGSTPRSTGKIRVSARRMITPWSA